MSRRKRLFNKLEIDYRAKKIADQRLCASINTLNMHVPINPMVKVSQDNTVVYVAVMMPLRMDDIEMFTE